jgi:hypothetical protein
VSGGGTVLYCISVSRRHSHSRFTELLLRSAQMASENVGHHVDVKTQESCEISTCHGAATSSDFWKIFSYHFCTG